MNESKTLTPTRLEAILLEHWAKHKSTRPGEQGTPDTVFYSVKEAAKVLTQHIDALTAEIETLKINMGLLRGIISQIEMEKR